MAEHTPTPWSAIMHRAPQGISYTIHGRLPNGSQSNAIAQVLPAGDAVGTDANLDFLIDAVNSHDELLAALKECLCQLQDHKRLLLQCEAALAAIAKAEGEVVR